VVVAAAVVGVAAAVAAVAAAVLPHQLSKYYRSK
jgi:hypothetical protein